METYFTTVNANQKKYLFSVHERQLVLLNAFKFLVVNNRCSIVGFVLMTNRFHLIWQIHSPHDLKDVQHSLLSFTSKQLLNLLPPDEKESYNVDSTDRKYQLFQRNPLSIKLESHHILWQKLNYIHENPVRAKMVMKAVEYKYSSSASYEFNADKFGFLTMI